MFLPLALSLLEGGNLAMIVTRAAKYLDVGHIFVFHFFDLFPFKIYMAIYSFQNTHIFNL